MYNEAASMKLCIHVLFNYRVYRHTVKFKESAPKLKQQGVGCSRHLTKSRPQRKDVGREADRAFGLETSLKIFYFFVHKTHAILISRKKFSEKFTIKYVSESIFW